MDFDFTNDSIIPSSGTLNISSATGGIIVPTGDTASRPGSPVEGLIRYNTDNNAFDVYANGQWQALIPSPNTGAVIIEDIFINRPAPGIADRLFIATDTHIFYRDNGTTWDAIGDGIGGGGTPAPPVNSVQFNNAGSFGGTSNFLWDNTNNRLDILGADQTQRLRIGGSDDPNNSTVYIQVNGDAVSEGIRTYFKRSSPGISGWITYHYDGNTPNIRLYDEDDDPPYIQFNTIGTGSFASPQYSNYFGSRGPTAGATTGFEWRVNGTTAATLDSNFFAQPSGTTGQRPGTPIAGMTRFNTTSNREEVYGPSNWVSNIGVIDKSTINTVITTAGPNNTYSFTVPGGTLGIDGILRLKLSGRWQNSSGANRTVTIAVSYGGTTMWADTSQNLSSGSDCGWNIELLLSANNSVTSQKLNGWIMIGGTGASNTGVTGDLASDEIISNAQIVGNNAAINSANAQTLNVTVTFSNSGITWTKYYHSLELL